MGYALTFRCCLWYNKHENTFIRLWGGLFNSLQIILPEINVDDHVIVNLFWTWNMADKFSISYYICSKWNFSLSVNVLYFINYVVFHWIFKHFVTKNSINILNLTRTDIEYTTYQFVNRTISNANYSGPQKRIRCTISCFSVPEHYIGIERRNWKIKRKGKSKFT